MKHYDIITVGGAVRDLTFYTERGKIIKNPTDLTAQKLLAFEYGAKININDAALTCGGGAANTAVSFAKLGFKTAALARLGNDSDGNHLKLNLRKAGVATDLLQYDNFLATGFSIILGVNNREKEHVALLYRGANCDLDASEKSFKSISADYLYLTSLSGRNWGKALKNVFYYAKKIKAKVAWNPGNLQLQAGKKVIAKYLAQTKILILNKDEAIELVLSGIKVGRRDPKFLNKPVYLLNILNEWGPKIIVITEGESGATAFKDGKIYKIKALKKIEADTTGVGDAFGSAFVAGIIYHKGDIKQSLIWGILNSGSVVTKIGAQNGILSRKEILETAKRVKQ